MAITEAGIYRARPVSPEATLAEASTGTVQAAVEFEIISQGYEGERIWWYGPLTERAVKNTAKGLRNCGWTGVKFDEAIILDTNAEVDLDIAPEEYNGKVKIKVNWVNKPGEGSGAPTPMDAAKRKAFAARMNGFLMKDRPGAGPGPAPKGAAPKPAPSRPPATTNPGLSPAQLGLSDQEPPF
jgi:hypothetical protein